MRLKYIIRIWCKGAAIGYMKALSPNGVISKTVNEHNARSFVTEWDAQRAVDNAVVDALQKGYVLEIVPMYK